MAASETLARGSSVARSAEERRGIALRTLGAVAVFAALGTSPLYAIRECLAWDPSGKLSPYAVIPTLPNVLGVLSLVFWALVIVIGLKYMAFVLRADNQGEGGILALAALYRRRRPRRLAIPLLFGLFGTGLLFGDGVITPAISVLSAAEGLSEHDRGLAGWVVPISAVILVALFVLQRRGIGGLAFGPILLLWFVAIGVVGLRWILAEPVVLHALDPAHAASFLTAHGIAGFLMLGVIVLVITGAEALYVDLGHYGKRSVRIAWFGVALPGVVLSYFGQGALLLVHEPGAIQNPFYAAVPDPFLIPMIVLAMAAAIIASQTLISGVFSIMQQAIQLGFWPRATVVHTSARRAGRIYVPGTNVLLMFGCLAAVFWFGSSSGLVPAYGVAVSGAMLITTLLLYSVCRVRWRYSRPRAIAVIAPFLAIDVAFVAASATRITHGGWFPFAIAAFLFAVMTTWRRGRSELTNVLEAASLPEELFLADVPSLPVPRVTGTAVFMTSTRAGIPNVLLHHVKHDKVLHEQVVLLTIETENVPMVDVMQCTEVRELGRGFFRVVARYGFVQRPDVPDLLARCANQGIVAQPMSTTFYLGRETLLIDGTSPLARWRKVLFAFLARNARTATEFFHLPPNRVVELGAQIQI